MRIHWRWMMTEEMSSGRKRRRRRLLTPPEKYQVWLEVVTGQGSQREIADKWGGPLTSQLLDQLRRSLGI